MSNLNSSSKAPQKQQDQACQGCPHSAYNGQRGLFGAWECRHPDNPSELPLLSHDLVDGTQHCRVQSSEMTDRELQA